MYPYLKVCKTVSCIFLSKTKSNIYSHSYVAGWGRSVCLVVELFLDCSLVSNSDAACGQDTNHQPRTNWPASVCSPCFSLKMIILYCDDGRWQSITSTQPGNQGPGAEAPACCALFELITDHWVDMWTCCTYLS